MSRNSKQDEPENWDVSEAKVSQLFNGRIKTFKHMYIPNNEPLIDIVHKIYSQTYLKTYGVVHYSGLLIHVHSSNEVTGGDGYSHSPIKNSMYMLCALSRGNFIVV